MMYIHCVKFIGFSFKYKSVFEDEGIQCLVKQEGFNILFLTYPGLYSSRIWNIQRGPGCYGRTQWPGFDGTADQRGLVFCSGSTQRQEKVKRANTILVKVTWTKQNILLHPFDGLPAFLLSFSLEVDEDAAGVQTGDVVDNSSVIQMVSPRFHLAMQPSRNRAEVELTVYI